MLILVKVYSYRKRLFVLTELKWLAGQFGFAYKAEVVKCSSQDFYYRYKT